MPENPKPRKHDGGPNPLSPCVYLSPIFHTFVMANRRNGAPLMMAPEKAHSAIVNRHNPSVVFHNGSRFAFVLYVKWVKYGFFCDCRLKICRVFYCESVAESMFEYYEFYWVGCLMNQIKKNRSRKPISWPFPVFWAPLLRISFVYHGFLDWFFSFIFPLWCILFTETCACLAAHIRIYIAMFMLK